MKEAKGRLADDQQKRGSPSDIGMPHVRRALQPDRDARVFLRVLNLATGIRPVENYSLRQLRQVWRLTAFALGSKPLVGTVTNLEIEGPGGPLALRLFNPRPAGEPLPAFVWCHGGGFMVGGLDTAEPICRSIAHQAGCITIAVRYRLAPEHNLLAGREDFLAALEWIAEHGASLGIDTSRLAIGGDSAGGNISAAVAQEALRRGGPALCLQVLAYPATDLLQQFPSYAENASGYLVTDTLLERIQQSVAGSLETLDPTTPWLSPRRNPDLRGLPPALVISAGFDPIRDDGLDYSARLRAAGVSVELLHFAGQFHGFLNFDMVLGAGREALQQISAALAAVFRNQPAPDRTLEIAEQQAATASAMCVAMGELATACLVTSMATAGWSDTLLRQLSPKAARVSRLLLAPWLSPARLMRRVLTAHLNPLTAEQTYPHLIDCQGVRP
ncbi:alpha/beta hydrolase [Pseudomonas sp. NA-150]|uniref:alpha/beta hydrolase n=1 Tax=Pseudomonas sp. NA-150 TaxID=3367525 RepID=UPI0037C6CDAD